ncbi:PEP-CTERM sorting domain-containing protein [Crocosphaera watsonii]
MAFQVKGGATIPEPLTILGSATALGFGTFFKRKLSKKQRKS